ncbi:MAG: glycine cleavage H-protein [Bacteroidetes bacterium]|jgi:glycine cleavage system H protein|nr:glycine cleavage H-protein [Bacteroidota bacterium]
MTVLFVLATLTLFLTVDHFVHRNRTRKAAQLVAERLMSLGQTLQPVPEGIRLRANHTWSKEDPQGTVTVGLDEFLAKFLGAVESLAIPSTGAQVSTEARGITLENGGKTIRLAPPVSGKVVSVNPDVLRAPALAATDPYGRGWLMKIQAEKNVEGMVGGQAMQWLREQTEAAREFFGSLEGHGAFALVQDGGEVMTGLLKQYDGGAWTQFQHQFLDQEGGAGKSVSTRSNQ